MTGIASQFIYGPATAAGVGSPIDATGKPYGYWMRDWVHANDRAKMILGRTLEAYFAPPPILKATTIGNQMTLTWPLASIGYHLETTSTLSTNSSWVSNAAVGSVTNGRIMIAPPLSAGAQFYRLRRS
jgi:hypothetical protein